MPGGATFFTASAFIPLRSIPADAVKNIWYPRYYRVVHFLTSATGTLLNQRVVHFGVDKHTTVLPCRQCKTELFYTDITVVSKWYLTNC